MVNIAMGLRDNAVLVHLHKLTRAEREEWPECYKLEIHTYIARNRIYFTKTHGDKRLECFNLVPIDLSSRSNEDHFLDFYTDVLLIA